jgi:Zn-dependent protease with chaperone function
MIKIRGYWYDGRSSSRTACELQVDASGSVVVLDEEGIRLFNGRFHDLEVSSRLGNTPRFINFPQGQRLETADNDLVDQILARLDPQSRKTWLHKLESRKRFVFITLLVVIVFIWGVVRYGAPVLAKTGANWIPQQVVRIAGEQTLATLDKIFLKPSRLPSEVRERVTTHLARAVDDHPNLKLRILFRSSEKIGPNAFALPDGTIVFTDAMVELAKVDDELLAVLAHEIGHVKYRHSMRMIIQNSTLAFLLAVIAGDISGTSELFLGLPILLTELAYSREFEREADTYAVNYLRHIEHSPAHFANIMRRLEESLACENDDVACKEREKKSTKWMNYLSSHPSTSERIESVDTGRK